MQNKSDLARKNFAVISSFILGGLTLVSLVASYSTYLLSFADWPTLAPIFSFLVTFGVEVAFIVLVYGMMRALLGGEMPVAGFGAASLLIVMAVNFVVHSRVARGLPLEPWQETWQNWIGLVVPFFTIALFILISFISPEARERRQERRMNYIGKQRALDYKEDYLNSPDLEAELESTQGAIAHSVRQHILKTLPPAPSNATASNRPQIGFRQHDNPQARAMDMMRRRYFGDEGKS